MFPVDLADPLFGNFLFKEDSQQTFAQYSWQGQPLATEEFGPARHIVPSTRGIWSASLFPPAAVRTCFVTGPVLEALCFAGFHFRLCHPPNRVAFVALGLLPCREQLEAVRKTYPQARIASIFERTLIGRVTDCRIAVWTKGRSISIQHAGTDILIRSKEKSFRIPEEKISLSYFERLTGIRSGVRTYKARRPFLSFREMVMGNII